MANEFDAALISDSSIAASLPDASALPTGRTGRRVECQDTLIEWEVAPVTRPVVLSGALMAAPRGGGAITLSTEIDVSLETSSIRILDHAGAVVCELKVQGILSPSGRR